MKDKEVKPQVLDTLETSEINRETINYDSVPNHGPVHIQVSQHYALGSDTHSWQILKRRMRNGVETWEAFKWYSTLDRAGEGLFDLMIRTSGATCDLELLQAVTSSRNAIRHAFENAFSLWSE